MAVVHTAEVKPNGKAKAPSNKRATKTINDTNEAVEITRPTPGIRDEIRTRRHFFVWFPLVCLFIFSGQIIIFHQPRFPWNKGISLPIPFGFPLVWFLLFHSFCLVSPNFGTPFLPSFLFFNATFHKENKTRQAPRHLVELQKLIQWSNESRLLVPKGYKLHCKRRSIARQWRSEPIGLANVSMGNLPKNKPNNGLFVVKVKVEDGFWRKFEYM